MNQDHGFACRPGCGACCIAASISTPFPGMPQGKPAGIRCVHLTDEYLCGIWDSGKRPKVCADLKPEPEMCGSSREEALAFLAALEKMTDPDR